MWQYICDGDVKKDPHPHSDPGGLLEWILEVEGVGGRQRETLGVLGVQAGGVQGQ